MDRDRDDYSSFRSGTNSQDTPNPLRPYYIPPSIGNPSEYGAPPSRNASGSRVNISAPGLPPLQKAEGFNARNSARQLLPDLDYADYLPNRAPSMAETAKNLIDQALWSYTSVLLAHPFEVAKTILQCRAPIEGLGDSLVDPAETARVYGGGAGFEAVRAHDTAADRLSNSRYAGEDDFSEESDGDAPSYFTSNAAPSHSPSYADYAALSSPGSLQRHRNDSYRQRRSKVSPSRSHSTTPTPGSINPSQQTYRLQLKRPDAIFDVVVQLWQKEAAWGVWKGTNATFIYNILLRTGESWMRSLLAALMNLPEGSASDLYAGVASLASAPGPNEANLSTVDILGSPSPMASLTVTVAAAGLTALILSPLDTIRTRLVITPTSSSPRAILPSLRSLPSFVELQKFLGPSTFIHATVPALFSNAIPLLLRGLLRIDPILTPTLYGIASFTAASAELFIRLPLETVLRRGQVALLQRQASLTQQTSLARSGRRIDDGTGFSSIVPVGPFKGVIGTMWSIVYEEDRPTFAAADCVSANDRISSAGRGDRGQGVQGLWRGWRVGFWGLVGVWGAAALGSGGVGGEF